MEAAIARPFGRNAVKNVVMAGGALQTAEIDGTDAQREISAADAKKTDIGRAQADVERELLRRDLTPAVRAKLLERRAELAGAQRESSEAANAARDSVQSTSMSFTYEAGAGVGLIAGVAEAGHQAYGSLTWTVVTLLTILAYASPPFLVLLLLLLLWHWYGRRLFRRLFPADQIDG
ncbi:MAG: hypothetical protein KAY22_22925 [Rhizorhabdus sp.]|uniref:hypothetical protein n=1 Tax=Rhizorhabdus sp. TaxID=1968843 RepID=UPI001B539BD6|nr:hypothetical protein [Rhizorhabdus sp.]MBP8235156.1 hypothetical protein [Rhizorhabdus sp.]